MIYYNGNYYLHQFQNNGTPKYTTTYIREGALTFDENGTPIDKDPNNSWIKIEQ